VAAGLRERGHDVQWATPFDSGMGHEHAIELVRDADDEAAEPTLAAATDPRSEGAPAVW
jgi:gamma-glutamyltranspeptidase